MEKIDLSFADKMLYADALFWDGMKKRGIDPDKKIPFWNLAEKKRMIRVYEDYWKFMDKTAYSTN